MNKLGNRSVVLGDFLDNMPTDGDSGYNNINNNNTTIYVVP